VGALPKPSYILKDRAIIFRQGYSADADAWPCIFCGEHSEHVNGGGTHCWLGAIYDGEAEQFSYCNEEGCRETGIEQAYETGLIWRCGCAGDYVENIGNQCSTCQRVRDDRVAVFYEG
jgi:hypothetical protein